MIKRKIAKERNENVENTDITEEREKKKWYEENNKEWIMKMKKNKAEISLKMCRNESRQNEIKGPVKKKKESPKENMDDRKRYTKGKNGEH